MFPGIPTLPTLSVSELNRYIRELLESDDVLQDLWVSGEISNLSTPSSGHVYLTLKDRSASLRCVIWRSTVLRIRYPLQNGLAVEAHGQVGVYEQGGQYQLYIDAVRPAGEGALYREFLRLKARLEAEGLFEEERKRLIPEQPRLIGIVTSPTGAALQDMLNTLAERYPLAEIVLSPTSVQGDAAPAEIVRALERLNIEVQPDVILLGRGGGSLEDLWAFNTEEVVRAVAGSQAPVITGIGHETDFTLSDFASDLRAPTPTGAAVLAVPHISEIKEDLDGTRRLLVELVKAKLAALRVEFREQRLRLVAASPLRDIQSAQQGLDEITLRAGRVISQTIQLNRTRLSGVQSHLAALNPNAIFERGYALVTDEKSVPIRSIDELEVGQPARIVMKDGTAKARIEEKKTTPKEE